MPKRVSRRHLLASLAAAAAGPSLIGKLTGGDRAYGAGDLPPGAEPDGGPPTCPLSGIWRGYAAAGVSFNERGGPLAELQNGTVPFAGIGFAARLSRRASFHAQVQWHRRLHDDSTLRNLGRDGVLLGVGGGLRLTRALRVDLAIIEDPAVNVSPDFGVQVRLAAY